MPEPTKPLTPTELLMQVAQEFSESEACDVTVIYFNEQREIVYRTNITDDHKLIGQMVMVSDRVRDRIRRSWSGEIR